MSELRKAKSLYSRFSGHDPEVVGKINVPPLPKTGVAIGTVDGIMYTTVRDGETQKYIHQFKHVDKPLFVVSPTGKQLFMIGGSYDFTDRGIVDKSDIKTRAILRAEKKKR